MMLRRILISFAVLAVPLSLIAGRPQWAYNREYLVCGEHSPRLTGKLKIFNCGGYGLW
jgi:hypothetical protein